MTYWVTLRYHATGTVRRLEYETALLRALTIIMTSSYADVVEQGTAGALEAAPCDPV